MKCSYYDYQLSSRDITSKVGAKILKTIAIFLDLKNAKGCG